MRNFTSSEIVGLKPKQFQSELQEKTFTISLFSKNLDIEDLEFQGQIVDVEFAENDLNIPQIFSFKVKTNKGEIEIPVLNIKSLKQVF